MKIKETMVKYVIPIILAGAYLVQLGAPIYINNNFTRDIGEGFKVCEVGSWRRIYDEKNGHFYLSHKGGGLERTAKSFPIPPMGGGPGWALCEIKTSNEDRERFGRANYLLSLNKNLKGGNKK